MQEARRNETGGETGQRKTRPQPVKDSMIERTQNRARTELVKRRAGKARRLTGKVSKMITSRMEKRAVTRPVWMVAGRVD